MKTIKISQLSNLKMVTSNEKKISKVVHNGVLKEWVGIGWIPLRDATKRDIERYYTVEE